MLRRIFLFSLPAAILTIVKTKFALGKIRQKRKIKNYPDWIIKGPILLECPCGLPLSISQDGSGRWILGHLEETCSHLIHCETVSIHQNESNNTDEQALGKIMEIFVSQGGTKPAPKSS